jgi:adenylate cyclase
MLHARLAGVQDLYDWLLDGAPGATLPVQVAERLGKEIAAAGVPLMRLGVFVRTLHPNVVGRAFIWEAGKPTRVADLTPAIAASHDFSHSPVAWVYEHHAEFRWRTGEPDRGYRVIPDLVARGCVDYVALPLTFSNGEIHVITFAGTRAFSDEQLGGFRRLVRPLARVAEIFALRRIAKTLLETYLGKVSGDRVLAGQITRGDVDTIRAAIWFSDLRGFTALSSRRSAKSMIETLNRVFDCQVPAIEKRGGEVLKFIGDGLLAIFQVGEHGSHACCGAALDAAHEAFAAVAKLEDEEQLRIGLALHLGDVEYGNIGGVSRLDFTAIGSAVNLAARLEGIASKTSRSLVMSAEFAAQCGRACEDLGAFELKGIPTPQHVFGLPEGVACEHE